MNYLRVEVIRRSCAFVLHVHDPVETLKRLAMFFQDRGIGIDSLSMHRLPNGEATIIIHCQVEKDRIHRTVDLLEKLPGIMELEKMEAR